MRSKVLLAAGLLSLILIISMAYSLLYSENTSLKLGISDDPSTNETESEIVVSEVNKVNNPLPQDNQLKSHDNTEVHRLKAEIAQIKAELSALKQQFSRYQVQLLSEPEEQMIRTGNREIRNNEEIAAAINEDEKIILEQQAIQQIEQSDYLTGIFSAESVDSSWSYLTADMINQALQAKELSNTSVLSVQCKSTMCRVEVEHDDPGKADEFALWFPHLVSETLPDIVIDKQDHEDGFYTTIVFLAQEGDTLSDK